MDATELHTIRCPYCGERTQVTVDISAGDQSYIEDCEVCCRPIELRLQVQGSEWQLQVRRDDE